MHCKNEFSELTNPQEATIFYCRKGHFQREMCDFSLIDCATKSDYCSSNLPLLESTKIGTEMPVGYLANAVRFFGLSTLWRFLGNDNGSLGR